MFRIGVWNGTSRADLMIFFSHSNAQHSRFRHRESRDLEFRLRKKKRDDGLLIVKIGLFDEAVVNPRTY